MSGDETRTVTEDTASVQEQTKRSWARAAGRAILISLGIVLAFLTALIVLIYLMQDRMIYARTPKTATPPGWTFVDLGEQRRGWWTAPRAGARTILFFHGNATTIAGIAQATRKFREKGYGVLAPEYPGYAGTPGDPDEKNITREADLAMDWLARKGVSPNETVVYGHSLGSGPAIHAAARPHLALVIISGMASLPDVARAHYGPIGGYVRDQWQNARALKAVKGHKIIVHGTADTVIPFDQGDALATSAGVPLIIIPGGHEIAFDEGLQASLAVSIDNRAKQGR